MKKVHTLILFLAYYSGLFAQTTNGLGFPSPNNSFLGRVPGGTGVGVDLYTGTAQVNVPICNLVSKDLSLPVSLQYTAGRGIKVQDYATCTGLGWQLTAGGSISRVVRGFPDEFPNGYLGTGLTGKQLENYYNGVPGATFPAGVDNGANPPTSDGEPDIYYVRTPRFSFQFTFDGNGNPVFSNESGIKINANSFFNSSNYQNSSFSITDANGNVYSFGDYKENTITTLYGASYTFTTTWYLSSIYTFNSKDYVNFNYQTSVNNDFLKHYQWARSYVNGCQDNTGSDPVPITIVQPKFISSIVCANGEIDFSYAFDRRDVTTSARLSRIDVRSNGAMGISTLQSFGFNYSYFGDPSTDTNLLRLRLDNINITGGTVATSSPVTYRIFSYNTSSNLPGHDSQNFDYWGYFRLFGPVANPDPMSDPTLRTPNAATTMIDVLTGIQELTGASWSLTYESNDYYKTSNNTNANVQIGGLRVKSLSKTLPTGENIQTTYQYTDNTGKSSGRIIAETYNLLVLNIIDPNLCALIAQKVFSESPIITADINGTFVGYSSVKTIFQNGGYTISQFYNFDDYPDVFSSTAVCSDVRVPSMVSSISAAYKRGLLKSQAIYNASNTKISEDINSYSSLNNPVIKKGFAYKWFMGSAFCNGMGGYRTMSGSYNTNVEDYVLAGTVHNEYDQVNTTNYIQTTTNYAYCPNKRTVQSINITDSKGNAVSTTFYHADDVNIPMLTSQEQSALSAMQGSNNLDALVHETDNKNGAITQMHNSYSVNVAGSSKAYLTAITSYKGTTLLNTQNFVYDVNSSNLLSSNAVGGKSSAIVYGYNNCYPIARVVNASSYYGTQQSTGSFGSTFSTGYFYSFTADYSGTIGWSLYGMGLNGSANISYTLSGPGNQSGSGCIGTGCSSYLTASFPNMPAGSYTLQVTVTSAPTGASFYISGSYPKNVAVLNNEFFYEGFEGTSSAISGSAHTGNKYWDATASPYSVNYTPPNNRNYAIQWWNWVNGKWVFNERAYTSPVTLSGGLDDIRVFPSDAQMSTYTYDPQVGKTGETDPSGRTITYEYDGLGRLNITRDNNKNIISKNCYNFSGLPVSCPAATIYSNAAKSATFTRNNCAAGYTGSTMTYTVAAGTYTSSISQADADQKALNDINTNGQNYVNTNGTCYQIWYNFATSGTFTRNNCGTGSTGSSVTYTVPAGTYSSTISQADANQKAINDVNANGQAYANANGTCTSTGCAFNMASGFNSPTNNVSSSGGVTSFYLVFYSTSYPITVGSTNLIATITGSCPPTSTRYLSLYDGGNSWQVTIYSNGDVYAQLVNGTTVNPGSTVYFSSSYTQ